MALPGGRQVAELLAVGRVVDLDADVVEVLRQIVKPDRGRCWRANQGHGTGGNPRARQVLEDGGEQCRQLRQLRIDQDGDMVVGCQIQDAGLFEGHVVLGKVAGAVPLVRMRRVVPLALVHEIPRVREARSRGARRVSRREPAGVVEVQVRRHDDLDVFRPRTGPRHVQSHRFHR